VTCRHRHRSPRERQAAEARARASVEARTGPLTDEEWRTAAHNLKRFLSVLASWEHPGHFVDHEDD
jgi:hypothetical protein